jgi:hypothetical protein
MSVKTDLRTALKVDYEILIDKYCRNDIDNKKLSGFFPLIGSEFEISPARLMVCGRAVNGWRYSWNPSEGADSILNKIFRVPDADGQIGCDMNWLQRSREKHRETLGKDGYNYKKSPFWMGIQEVVCALDAVPASGVNSWQKRVAWTNVYKISPANGGNPDHFMRANQLEHCKNILAKEIDGLKPKHLLCITGDWGKKILEHNGIVIGESKGLVRYAGLHRQSYGNLKVVVADRPEGKKRDKWVGLVLDAFSSL